jgi:iron complex outermembrane recepter protein
MRIGKNLFRMLATCLLLVVATAGFSAGSEIGSDEGAMLDLSLEALLDIEVTSVSKRAQSLSDAPAAIFVISSEDMEEQGVTNIADALRMVPGLHVGRIDANKWAVTSRGFNGRFNNKLLVLVDGRSVYTPIFSGVYWEVQDVMLEDIARIEIIRGPGSTLWGANAVNGVINIITKHAADTQGGLAVAGGGEFERGFGALRWGAKLADGSYARFYGKAFHREEFERVDGQDAGDDWNMFRAGFRIDTQKSAAETITLQGDVYRGEINQQTTLAQLTPPYSSTLDETAEVSGGNILARLVHTLSPSSEISFQAYYDRAVRDEALAKQITNQVDYDFQHQLSTSKHTMVWGLGFRQSDTQVGRRSGFIINDEKRSFSLLSLFFQDEICLKPDRLALTLGTKIEHNDFTGVEIQPSARLMWRAHEAHRLWTAVSRAVRTPMSVEDEFELLLTTVPPGTAENPGPLPVAVMITGNDDYGSEELLAYELGYRFTHASVSADIALYYHDYTNLQNNELGEVDVRYMEDPMYVAQPLVFDNGSAAADYGAEIALAWQSRSWIRWDLAYSTLRSDENTVEAFRAHSVFGPEHQVSLNLGLHPVPTVKLNASLRYVDDCESVNSLDPQGYQIPSYTTMDLRLGWLVRDGVELSVMGRNLLEENHFEYGAESFTLPTEVPRSVYAKIRWSF